MTAPERFLAEAARPGRHAFALAAGLHTLGTAAVAGQAAALALLVAGAPGGAVGALALGAGATAVRAATTAGAQAAAGAGTARVLAALRRALLLDLLDLRPRRPADPAVAAGAVLEDTERLSGFAERYHPAVLACGPSCAVVLGLAWWQDWLVGLLLVLAAPLVGLNMVAVGLGAQAATRRQAEQTRLLSARLVDRLAGLRGIVGLGAGERERDRLALDSHELGDRTMRVLRVAFLSSAVLEGVTTFAVAIVATYVGLVLLGYVPGEMSLATALFLLLLTPLFFAPLRAVAAAHHDRADALTAAEALAATVPAVPVLPPVPAGAAVAAGAPIAAGAAIPVDVGPAAAAGRVPPAVVLDRVDVSWPGRERPALAGVTARLEPGRIAVVRGASGAGKSTLLAVVAGLTAPSSGYVRLVAEPGRAHGPAPGDIAWLGQRPAVFAATLRDNLVLGRRVTPRAVRDAVDVAGLAPVVADMPDGLDTWVGEGGYGLSTGQAHRLALARALLGDAPLWLLDEPTAHLDAATEADVVEALTVAIRGRTALVATHSPALDRLADQTWWLERGELLTTGGDHGP